jgi:hypothetical protein
VNWFWAVAAIVLLLSIIGFWLSSHSQRRAGGVIATKPRDRKRRS